VTNDYQGSDLDIAGCMHMVRSVVAAFRLPYWIEHDDLIGEGMLAVAEAATRYDPAGGASLPTFAWKRVRGRIANYLRREYLRCNLLTDDAEGASTCDVEEEISDMEILERVRSILSRQPVKRGMYLDSVLLGDEDASRVRRSLAVSRGRCKRWTQAFLREVRRELGVREARAA